MISQIALILLSSPFATETDYFHPEAVAIKCRMSFLTPGMRRDEAIELLGLKDRHFRPPEPTRIDSIPWN
jgi:hypothetical protein